MLQHAVALYYTSCILVPWAICDVSTARAALGAPAPRMRSGLVGALSAGGFGLSGARGARSLVTLSLGASFRVS